MSSEDLRAQVMPFIPPAFNPAHGTFTVNGLSTVNVVEPSVTAQSLIFYNIITVGGSIGVAAVTSRTAGVGFSVVSVALATSVYGYFILEP